MHTLTNDRDSRLPLKMIDQTREEIELHGLTRITPTRKLITNNETSTLMLNDRRYRR